MRNWAGVYLLAVVAAVVLAHAETARGACDPELVPQAVVAHIDRAGIDKVLAPAGGLIPQQLPLDGITVPIAECGLWFDDTVMHVQRGDVRLTNPQVDFVLDEAGFYVSIKGNLDISAHIDLEICALPDTSCDARVVAHGAAVVARVAVAVNECTPHLDMSNVVVRVDGGVDVDLSGCGIYDTIFGIVDGWFHDELVAYALDEVRNYIPELVASQVESISSNLVATGTTIDGVTFKAQPESLAIDAQGISLSFAMTTEHEGIADCVAGTDWRRYPAPPLPTWPTLSGSSIGISERFVQNTLESAWKAGWLCLDLATIYPEADSLIASFGANARVRATAGTLQPPRIAFTPSEFGEATISIAHLQGHMIISADNKPDLTADFLGGFVMQADALVKQATNEIVIKPRTFDMTPFEIEMNGQDIPFTQEGVDQYIRDEVTPVLASGVAELPIVSALFSTSVTPIDIQRLYTIEHGFIAVVHVGEVDTTDTTPPTTTDDNPPVCPCPDTVEVNPSGSDNSTPSNRIRYLVEVDGHRETQFTNGNSIHIADLGSGRHIIHVAAVDAMGNVDPVGVDYDTLPPSGADVLELIAGGGCASTGTDNITYAALSLVFMSWRRMVRRREKAKPA